MSSRLNHWNSEFSTMNRDLPRKLVLPRSFKVGLHCSDIELHYYDTVGLHCWVGWCPKKICGYHGDQAENVLSHLLTRYPSICLWSFLPNSQAAAHLPHFPPLHLPIFAAMTSKETRREGTSALDRPSMVAGQAANYNTNVLGLLCAHCSDFSVYQIGTPSLQLAFDLEKMNTNPLWRAIKKSKAGWHHMQLYACMNDQTAGGEHC